MEVYIVSTWGLREGVLRLGYFLELLFVIPTQNQMN